MLVGKDEQPFSDFTPQPIRLVQQQEEEGEEGDQAVWAASIMMHDKTSLHDADASSFLWCII